MTVVYFDWKFTDDGDPQALGYKTDSDSEYLPHLSAKGNRFFKGAGYTTISGVGVAYYWAYEIQKPVAVPLKITWIV